MALQPAFAQDRDLVLRAEFPVDLERPPSAQPFSGVTQPSYQPRLPDGEAARAVLEEARWVFGGMVWGFDFVYTPSDRARAIADLFTLTPRSELRWGTAGFTVRSVRLDGTTVWAAVEWNLGAAERSEHAAWAGSRYAAAQGRASIPLRAAVDTATPAGDGGALNLYVALRREAMSQAAKEALRAYLRGIETYKPREVRGPCAFAVPPTLVMREGAWIATVRLRVQVSEVLGYGSY